MTLDTEDIRLAIYTSLASTGHAPRHCGAGRDAGGRPGRDRGRPPAARGGAPSRARRRRAGGVLAHPFSTIDLGFSVEGTRQPLWWGGCIWDSFAIPHLVPGEPEVLVATTCQGCGQAHAWIVGREGPPEGDQVAHFIVPAAHMWDDVVFTCGNQRVFCERTLDQRSRGAERPDAVRLAGHQHEPRPGRGVRDASVRRRLRAPRSATDGRSAALAPTLASPSSIHTKPLNSAGIGASNEPPSRQLDVEDQPRRPELDRRALPDQDPDDRVALGPARELVRAPRPARSARPPCPCARGSPRTARPATRRSCPPPAGPRRCFRRATRRARCGSSGAPPVPSRARSNVPPGPVLWPVLASPDRMYQRLSNPRCGCVVSSFARSG